MHAQAERAREPDFPSFITVHLLFASHPATFWRTTSHIHTPAERGSLNYFISINLKTILLSTKWDKDGKFCYFPSTDWVRRQAEAQWWDIRVLGFCCEAALAIAFILPQGGLTYAQASIKLHP